SKAQDEPVRAEFIRIGGVCVSRSGLIPSTNIKDCKSSISITVQVKFIKSARSADLIPFSDKDEIARIQIKDEDFASTMKESIDGVYPVEDCEVADFRE
ncbi:hypothetical protein PMAYCL1PPCAC_22475, partial [Pristionchus mayeri]